MNIAIIGAGGHAGVVLDIVENLSGLSVQGIIDSYLKVGDTRFGYPILGGDDELPRLVSEHSLHGVIVAIGDNWRRRSVALAIRSLVPSLAFPTVAHPAACVSRSANLGSGCTIMAGSVINPGARLGDFCIINTLASIDHDCQIDNYASFAPHACAGGHAQVGECSAICLGAKLIHRVKVGSYSVVGAGATVLNDIPEHAVAYGTPAKVIRSRTADEPYM